MTAFERLRFESIVRAYLRRFVHATPPKAGGSDFAAVYVACLAIARGFKAGLDPELVPELDQLADEIAVEYLTSVGLSTEGAH